MSSFNYFDLYKKYMLIIGASGGLLFYLQAIRIFTLKNSKAISLSGFLLSALATFSWVVYGILLNDPVIWMPNLFGFIGCVFVVVGKFIYG